MGGWIFKYGIIQISRFLKNRFEVKENRNDIHSSEEKKGETD
jgi:hypothetical protein